MRHLFFAALLLLLCGAAIADSGISAQCGGFVRISPELAKFANAPKIDYSRVKINLLSSTGIVKDTTECAPNGYYLLPVYDKGSYTLKLAAPEGWQFDPSHVAIEVSSTVNTCHDDINFAFTGFSLAGEVQSPALASCVAKVSGGPSGVALSLKNEQGQQVASAVSESGGAFAFPRVLPGSYSVVAAGASNSPQKVQVAWGNSKVPAAFRVTGYTITGNVAADARTHTGATDVSVFLYGVTGDKVDAAFGCVAPAKGAVLPPAETAAAGGAASARPLCATKTDSKGAFSFPGLPCGRYVVVPFYKTAAENFDVTPAQLAVDVNAATSALAFTVFGFSAHGRVIDRNGAGIAGAKVLLDGRQSAVTDAKGVYRLEGVAAGSYTIEVTKEHHGFQTLKNVELSAAHVNVPEIVVLRFAVCGTVEAVENKQGRTVTLVGESQKQLSTTTDAHGRYCFDVPATSSMKVTVTAETLASERAKGIQISPAVRTVTVANAPVLGVDFSQTRVAVSGQVVHLSGVASANVEVQLSRAGQQSLSTKTDAKGAFKFTEVTPGSYSLSVQQPNLCWKSASADGVAVEVGFEDVKNVRVEQSGFALRVHCAHDEVALAVTNDASRTTQRVSLIKGDNRVCMPAAGAYTVRPQACLRFARESYPVTLNADASPSLDLVATEARVKGSIALTKVADRVLPPTLVVRVARQGGAMNEVVAQLRKNTGAITAGVYDYELYGRDAEHITVTPVSPAKAGLLFYPPARTTTVEAAHACQNELPQFEARVGVFIRGKVVPAVAGVEIVAHEAGTHNELGTATTDATGAYAIGPLNDALKFSVTPRAEGYHFTSKGGNDFNAMKQAEVRVRVVDQTEHGVSGVLLSMTGAEGYRNNSATDAHGAFAFLGLRGGSYNVRPILREYKFEPVAAAIEVASGGTQKVTFRATRVAFSVFGKVAMLDGAAAHDVTVEAVSQDGKSEESTKTDATGAYRLRGLQPGVQYVVRVHAEATMSHCAPAVRTIDVGRADTLAADFVAFPRSAAVGDITGVVESAPEWLDSVQIELVSGKKVVATTKVSSTLALFEFSNVPEGVYTVRARSSLNSRTHDIITEDVAVNLVRPSQSVSGDVSAVSASLHRHVAVNFSAEPRGAAAEGAMTSFLSLLLMLTGVTAFFWRNELLAKYRAYREKQREEATLKLRSAKKIGATKAADHSKAE